jgi:bifunctional oligoribonuclease and PAP phosphatase NrnA
MYDAINHLISNVNHVVIVSHRNPDGDAVGSSLGLFYLLKKAGLNPTMLLPSGIPDFFMWMQGAEHFIIWDNEPFKAESSIEAAEVIFCLDFNQLDRIDKMGELISVSNAKKILIDHHLNPGSFCDFVISDVTSSSTCQLIYEWAKNMNWKDRFDSVIATSLYVGILTDTGNFKYNITPKLFRLTAELFEYGIDNEEVQNKVFNSMSEKRLRLLGHALINRLEILEDFCTGIIVLNKSDYEQYQIERGDTEGIVNFVLQLNSVTMAILVNEQPSIIKLSMRSKGNFSVEEIARKYFKGGGHRNAAGGYSFSPLSETLKKLKDILPNYKQQLIETNLL